MAFASSTLLKRVQEFNNDSTYIFEGKDVTPFIQHESMNNKESIEVTKTHKFCIVKASFLQFLKSQSRLNLQRGKIDSTYVSLTYKT